MNLKYKKCTKCKKSYPNTREWFGRKPNGNLISECKSCKRKYNRKYCRMLKSRSFDEIIIPEEKRCCRCGKIKGSKEFHVANYNRDRLSNWCRSCKTDYFRLNRSEFYARNRELCRKLKNRKNIIVPKTKKCYKCGRTKFSNEFYACRSRKSGLSDECKICTKKRRTRDRKRRNENEVMRRRIDVNYRLRCRLSGQINRALKRQNLKKSLVTAALIECGLERFKQHITSLWKDKMTWANYGKNLGQWSIDHIKPCASFDLKIKNNQRKCFNYKNLRPLWNSDNFRKNAWYNGKLYRKKPEKYIV